MLIYPQIDPILYSIPLGQLTAGFLQNIPIRWYSMSYIAGILLSFCGIYFVQKKHNIFNKALFEDALNLSTLGIIIGGRLFYVIFYHPAYLLHDPLAIIRIWDGGMSFHGGCIGAITGLWWASKKHHSKFLQITDVAAIFTPIGLFLGRIANFINAELFGRPTSSYLGMIFPTDVTQKPRHPSQLYEASTEGIILFIIMLLFYRYTKFLRIRGMLSSIFLMSYSVMRFAVEFFREPDPEIGFFFGIISMGQILSLIMMMAGFMIFRYARKNSHT